jgi:hypothetical protein
MAVGNGVTNGTSANGTGIPSWSLEGKVAVVTGSGMSCTDIWKTQLD